MNLGQWIVIGLCALLVAWYFGASMFNRRRGMATYQWLRRGLEQVGDKIEAQWLGSSSTGAKLVIPRAEKPYRRLESTYLLETREILPYWILTHLRGRRDGLMIKVVLRKVPKTGLVVERLDLRNKTELEPQDQKQVSELVDAPEGFTIARYGPGDPESEQRLREFLSEAGEPIERISLQQKSPHLEIRMWINSLEMTPPVPFFEMLKKWLQQPSD